MRRLWIFLFTLLLTISLFGCAKQEIVYTVDKNGVEFRVDREEKTISCAKERKFRVRQVDRDANIDRTGTFRNPCA